MMTFISIYELNKTLCVETHLYVISIILMQSSQLLGQRKHCIKVSEQLNFCSKSFQCWEKSWVEFRISKMMTLISIYELNKPLCVETHLYIISIILMQSSQLLGQIINCIKVSEQLNFCSKSFQCWEKSWVECRISKLVM